MSSRTRVAVVGAGFFGQRHARQYASMPDVELVGVCDRSATAARTLAAELGCRAFADHAELLEEVDAVSVATPTVAHYPVARDFLEQGVPTLDEKPLAFSTQEARELAKLARRGRTVLQVGHVERFNPVWLAYERQPLRADVIQAERLSPYPFRGTDVSVVFDLMIHDLDLALAAAGSAPVSVEAWGGPCLSGSADRVEARIDFASGCRARIVASRVHHRAERTMRLWNQEALIDLDLHARSSTSYRRKPGMPLPPHVSPDQAEAVRQRLFERETATFSAEVQPLRLELEDFLRCARTGADPKVSGEEGYAAVALADVVERRLSAFVPKLRAA